MAQIACGELRIIADTGCLTAQLGTMPLLREPAPLYLLYDEGGRPFLPQTFRRKRHRRTCPRERC